MNEPKEYDIGYIVTDLLYEPIIDEMLRKLEIHNETLKNIAIISGEKTCKQVRVEGPALIVVDLNIETGEETI